MEAPEGFSEEREMDRVFEFVIHDPALKSVFTVVDKRAVISRYEEITGNRLITWAGELDLMPSVRKTEFSRASCCEGDALGRNTPHVKIQTLEEVSRELGNIPKEDIEAFIANGWLHVEKDPQGHFLVRKDELRGFKDYAMRDGLRLRLAVDKRDRPSTARQFKTARRRLDAVEKKQLPEKFKQIAAATLEKYKSKSK